MSKSTHKSGRRRFSLTTMVVAALVLAAASVTVISRQKAPAERQAQMADKTNFAAPKVVAQDGQLNPEPQALTADEAQKLAAGLKDLVNQSTDGLTEVKHDDGSVSVDLQGRFQNVTVARINKDGSVSQSCVDNPKSAGAFFGIDPKLIDKNSDTTGAKPIKTSAKPRN